MKSSHVRSRPRRRRTAGKVDLAPLLVGGALIAVLAVIVVVASRSESGERAANAAQTDLIPIAEARELMGTRIGVEARVNPVGKVTQEAARDAVAQAFETLDRMNGLFGWERSEVTAINLIDGKVELPISPDTAACIAAAEAWRVKTNGAFDIGVGSLRSIWQRAASDGAMPSDKTIKEARGTTGDKCYILEKNEEGAPVIKLRSKKAMIDVGGIAKGYAVDQAIATLRAAGVVHAQVNAGGDLYVMGGRDSKNRPWRIGIRDPRYPEESHDHHPPVAIVELRDQALCTSGDYEQRYEIGEESFTHIIDPRTGRPAKRGVASVSVIASTATDADAIATALSVMGPDEGLAFVEGLDGIDALFVLVEKGEIVKRSSAGWSELDIEVHWRKPVDGEGETGGAADDAADGDGDAGADPGHDAGDGGDHDGHDHGDGGDHDGHDH